MTNDGEDIRYVHADHLGHPQKMTDSTRSIVWDASFLPFGEEHNLTGSAANDNRFPGQRFEAETGLHYNYFRDYDPSTGRYLQSDPIGLAGGINTYGYVSGNPLRYVDPRGLNPVAGCAAGVWAGPIGCGIGAVIVGGISFGAIMLIPGDVPINDSIEENFCRLPDTFYSDTINEPEADDQDQNPPVPETESTPDTHPDDFENVKRSKAKRNKKTKEIWEPDMMHKDHWEVYKNKKNWEKRNRDRDVWSDGRPKRKF